MLSMSMSMTWRPLTYLRPFSTDFSSKIGYQTCVIHVFDNFDELPAVLPLVVLVDVAGGVHDVESGFIGILTCIKLYQEEALKFSCLVYWERQGIL